ncbi:glycoside hydrolase family 30 beta sandwich domain-containing protein [Micromonospora marina]|uniref:glycoside hydrolase family 30 beta sandwich domain-containing protein n=1 Tax=Micromonospora marina TaxID=307120 RepID=UPI0034542A7E
MSECTPGPTTTQQGVRNARRMHEFFTGPQGNAWVWRRYVTGSADATLPDAVGGMVTIDDRTGAYTIGKTVWTTAQFSRFVRPGWKRIDTTAQPTTGVYVTSFKDPVTGKSAVVVVNENTSARAVDLELTGVSTTSLWKKLGSWPFAPGSGDHVTITAADGVYTVADAVRFVKIG